MSGHKGLDKWFKQDWVDIGSKKKGGGHKKCGRSKQKADAKRKYPKCVPRAKAKFDVYPSAYANAYASKICAGKIKDPSGKKRKDFKGRKPSATGGRITKAEGGLTEATARLKRQGLKNGGSPKRIAKGCGKVMKRRPTTFVAMA